MTVRKGRLGCERCNWQGYIKRSFWSGEKEEVTVTVCSQCKDVRGYHMYVRQKYGNHSNIHVLDGGEPLAEVIDFETYKSSKELKYYDKKDYDDLAKKQFEEYGEIPRLDKKERI